MQKRPTTCCSSQHFRLSVLFVCFHNGGSVLKLLPLLSFKFFLLLFLPMVGHTLFKETYCMSQFIALPAVPNNFLFHTKAHGAILQKRPTECFNS